MKAPTQPEQHSDPTHHIRRWRFFHRQPGKAQLFKQSGELTFWSIAICVSIAHMCQGCLVFLHWTLQSDQFLPAVYWNGRWVISNQVLCKLSVLNAFPLECDASKPSPPQRHIGLYSKRGVRYNTLFEIGTLWDVRSWQPATTRFNISPFLSRFLCLSKALLKLSGSHRNNRLCGT